MISQINKKHRCKTFFLKSIFFFKGTPLFTYLFIYFWLCWVFISVRGLSLVAGSGGHSSSRRCKTFNQNITRLNQAISENHDQIRFVSGI